LKDASDRNLLVLAHCLPKSNGGVIRHRCFELLRHLSTTWQVHLACVCRGPVTMAQWQAVDALVYRLTLEPVGLRSRLLATLIRPRDADRCLPAALAGAVKRCTDEAHFDRCLITHPALARIAGAASCPVLSRDTRTDFDVAEVLRSLLGTAWPQNLPMAA